MRKCEKVMEKVWERLGKY